MSLVGTEPPAISQMGKGTGFPCVAWTTEAVFSGVGLIFPDRAGAPVPVQN